VLWKRSTLLVSMRSYSFVTYKPCPKVSYHFLFPSQWIISSILSPWVKKKHCSKLHISANVQNTYSSTKLCKLKPVSVFK
jgi:hypothetical protein